MLGPLDATEAAAREPRREGRVHRAAIIAADEEPVWRVSRPYAIACRVEMVVDDERVGARPVNHVLSCSRFQLFPHPLPLAPCPFSLTRPAPA